MKNIKNALYYVAQVDTLDVCLVSRTRLHYPLTLQAISVIRETSPQLWNPCKF